MIAELFVLLGSACFLIASLGLVRMPEPLARLHAGTKASSLGVFLLAVGAIIRFPQPFEIFLCLAMVFLIFLTAPLASHAVATRLIKEK